MATEVKDKRITIYEVISERTNRGFERKVKRKIHKVEKLWAYVRQLSDKEKFAGKAAGVEQSILFKVNYNAAISAGQFIEFKDKTYRIESVDRFEFNKQDLTLKAVECTALEAEYDEQQD